MSDETEQGTGTGGGGEGGGLLLLASLVLVATGMGAIVMQLYGPAMLSFIAAGALALARVARRRSSAESAPVPPVRVPPEEAELSEGPVSCCMRCGSVAMRQPRISEGLIPGVPLAWICGRCKWRGHPLEFENVTAYRQFVKGLQEGDGARERVEPEA